MAEAGSIAANGGLAATQGSFPGVRVGKRIIGNEGPVTVGWENIPRVEGGPVKQFFFTWFQPTMLFALLAFWYYAPSCFVSASSAIGIG